LTDPQSRTIIPILNYEISPHQPEIIQEPLRLPDLADPLPGTDAYAAAQQRIDTTTSIGAMPWLPQMPDAWAFEIYEKIEAYERTLVGPNRTMADYLTGTASRDDGLVIIETNPEGILFSAEHATKPVRYLPNKIGACDPGTGGLAALLGEQYGTAIIATGRQTSNAALVDNHPLKRELNRYLPSAQAYVSVHGMGAGKFVRTTDTANVHISIGLGQNPAPPESLALAENLVATAHDLGLYAIIGNKQQYYTQLRDSTKLKRNEDGTAYRHELGAFRHATTVNYVRRKPFNEIGHTPALQIELTSLLRLPIANRRFAKDKRTEIMGVALGYCFMEQVALLMQREVSFN